MKDFTFTVQDAINIFAEFDIIANSDSVGANKLKSFVTVNKAVGGSYNVELKPITPAGRLSKAKFSDCFLVTPAKIYRQQDFPGYEKMRKLNRYYHQYMCETYPEYKTEYKARKLKSDENAETFYGEKTYEC